MERMKLRVRELEARNAALIMDNERSRDPPHRIQARTGSEDKGESKVYQNHIEALLTENERLRKLLEAGKEPRTVSDEQQNQKEDVIN